MRITLATGGDDCDGNQIFNAIYNIFGYIGGVRRLFREDEG
jgi:hypothetical protein